MVVQAEAARRTLPTPTRTVTHGRSTASTSTGRQALAELRRLLGVLRADEDEAPLAPQPGVAELADLVDQVRAAGLPVELAGRGRARPLPAGVDLSAYRIVQEGLTNVLKHAGPARTHGDGALRRRTRSSVEVRRRRPRRRRRRLPAGSVWSGMRERVALLRR